MHSRCPKSETELTGFGGRRELGGCSPLSPSLPEKKRKSQSQVTYMSPRSKPLWWPTQSVIYHWNQKQTPPISLILALPFLSQGHHYFCQSWGLQIGFSPYQRCTVSSHPSPILSDPACITHSARPLWEARSPASITVLCSLMSTIQSGFPPTHFISVFV